MKRVYLHYQLWECWRYGLYKKQNQPEKLIYNSVDLLSDLENLYIAMSAVTNVWPNSTLTRLTNISSNRRSWLGQASCCLTIGSNEMTTCKAWWMLDKNTQKAANNVADTVIRQWERNYLQSKQLSLFD